MLRGGAGVEGKEVTLQSILKKQSYKENIRTSNGNEEAKGIAGVRPAPGTGSRQLFRSDYYTDTTQQMPPLQNNNDAEVVDHSQLSYTEVTINATKKVRFRETVTCVYTDDLDAEYYERSFEKIEEKSTRQALMSVARKLDQADLEPEPVASKLRTSKRNKQRTEDVQVSPVPVAVALNRRGGTGNHGLDVWLTFISEKENRKWVAPVSSFLLAPLGDVWDDVVKANLGHKFEMPNFKAESEFPTYKVATVIEFCGYMTHVEVGDTVMGCGGRPHLHWINFFDGLPKYIGFGAENGIPRYAPLGSQDDPKFQMGNPDPLELLLTIDKDHDNFVREQIHICQIIPEGKLIEVLDHNNISRMRLATVTQCVGDRVKVTHVTRRSHHTLYPQDTWWYSVYSALIRPLGWSKAIGYDILEAEDPRTETRIDLSFVPKYPVGVQLFEGHFLEACNPQKMEVICAVSVHTVLKCGYFLAAFKNLKYEDKEPTLFCFHVTSPFIFPCGFCEKHDINLVQPFEYRHLSPQAYVRFSRSRAAPLNLLPQRRPNLFKVGMKLEAADLAAPDYIGPATILKIADHMIFLQYDGWAASGWMPCHSTDIFPAGYCGLVGHTIKYQPNPVRSEHGSENGMISTGPKKRGRKRRAI